MNDTVNIPEQNMQRTASALPIGRVVSVTGSQAVVLLAHYPQRQAERAELGALLRIDAEESVLLGMVTALSVPVPAQREGEPEVRIAELELMGELPRDASGRLGGFERGVSAYPALGDKVLPATSEELMRAYLGSGEGSVRIGTLRQDLSIPAVIEVNELLGKHFAVLGSTGTGKSCAVALMLRAILRKNPHAHILLLDPHNEYGRCFGRAAEIITPGDLQLPFWFLTFEEIIKVVIGDQIAKEAEADILAELIPAAKSRYAANRGRDASGLVFKKRLNELGSFTVDTPVPYRISDLVAMIDERMGRLENKRDRTPYRQLKARIEAISQDPRYAFMFGSVTVQDHMTEILGRLFRVPVDGKPIAILELTGVPSDVVNVVVSVICRMTFDFALWGEGSIPITLICEEAHRYVPADPALSFGPAQRAIARIAKEGRKYGVSLGVISQRPAELDSTILAQCNTIFAMRMPNERDQEIVRAAIFDTAQSLLDFLPSLATGEAIVSGDGVPLPARIRFDQLPEKALPRGRTASFTEKWQHGEDTASFLDAVVNRWRAAGSPITSRGEDFDSDTAAAEAGSEAGDAAPPRSVEDAAPAARTPLRERPGEDMVASTLGRRRDDAVEHTPRRRHDDPPPLRRSGDAAPLPRYEDPRPAPVSSADERSRDGNGVVTRY